MNLFRDAWVVLGKEWLELKHSDSGWVTASTLAIFLGVVGVFLPWQLGLTWLSAPWVALVWAWLPLFLVTTVTADSVAGERERRTLETLLATRLSDAAIFWGKWAGSVIWVWVAMALCLPIGILTINLTLVGGPHLPGAGHAAGMLAAALGGASFGAAAGVLVSLRSGSVRHAQQVLAIGALVVVFMPIAALQLLPTETTLELAGTLMYGDPARLTWTLAAALAVLTLPLAVLGVRSFRRGRISLK